MYGSATAPRTHDDVVESYDWMDDGGDCEKTTQGDGYDAHGGTVSVVMVGDVIGGPVVVDEDRRVAEVHDRVTVSRAAMVARHMISAIIMFADCGVLSIPRFEYSVSAASMYAL